MTDFLYPFLDEQEHDPHALLEDLARSAAAKATASARLREQTLSLLRDDVARAGDAMAERFARGGQLFTFGNGGSAADAAGVADLFVRPPAGAALPARALCDEAVLTALGNDVGFDLVFARQLIAHARPTDIALAISTSGNSQNLVAAAAEAHRLGLLTVGVAGYDGGSMAAPPHFDHCLVVRADSVHRIQETQAAVLVALWSAVHESRRAAPA